MMGSSVNFVALLVAVALMKHGCAKDQKRKFKSQTMDPVNITEYGLLDEEVGVVEISKKNFKKLVTSSHDAWIVVVYKHGLEVKWKEHAKRVKGAVFYGMVNFETEQELVAEWDADLHTDSVGHGVAFVFNHGSKTSTKSKQFYPKRTRKPIEAERMAAGSFRDNFEKLNFRGGKEKFNEWILKAYYKSNPSKFPVICVVDESKGGIPLSLRAISYYFDTHFAFSVIDKNHLHHVQGMLKEMPIPKTYPFYFIMLGKEPSQEEMSRGDWGMHFNTLPYIEEKYGNNEDFMSILKYFYTINDDYRTMLPGRNREEPRSTTEMREVTRMLNKRITKIVRVTSSSKPKHQEL